MAHVSVRLALAPGMPRPLGADGRASLFGTWLRERIASIALDWPGVGFHRIELIAGGVRLVLVAHDTTPPSAVGLAIGQAVRTEVQAAALQCCGLTEGSALWRAETIAETIDDRRETRDDRR